MSNRGWILLRALLAAVLLLPLAAGALRADSELSPSFDALAEGTRAGARNIKGKPQQSSPRAIFRIISWNVQTFGSGINPAREKAYGELLGDMFSTSRSAKVLAVQEIASEKGGEKFSALLPGKEERWNRRFQDSADSQDNGFFTQRGVETRCEQFLFPVQDENGRWRSDPAKAQHPVRASHMRVGDFDFTLLTLHLSFKPSDPGIRERELRAVLSWLEEYLQNPANDPDVIIAGDFNMPVRGGTVARYKGPSIEDVIESIPALGPEYDASGRRVRKAGEMISFVDEPTSRSKGQPKNNYDHFILSGDIIHEEFVEGSAGPFPAKMMAAIEKKHDIYVSDHLPISAGFLYKGEGNDGRTIALDQPFEAGEQPARGCWNAPALLADMGRSTQ